MRDRKNGLALVFVGLLGVSLGTACGSSESSKPVNGLDAATSPGGGGTTGQATSSSSSSQAAAADAGAISPVVRQDAGLQPDAAADAAAISPIAHQDAAVQPDAALDAGSISPDARQDAGPQLDTKRPVDAGFGGDSDPLRDADQVLYGLTAGSACYKVTAIVPGDADGCGLEAQAVVGHALQGSYDSSTGVFTLGNAGSLGSGLIRYNEGTLIRAKSALSDTGSPACAWNQEDTTKLTMTGTNHFTVFVIETQDHIAAACGTAFASCTSTWAWTMEIDSTQKAPNCQ